MFGFILVWVGSSSHAVSTVSKDIV